ncbi:hypothetical protein R3Q08_31660 [Rhodococcus erythropolis]|nr:hypothetical protein [Rhodococcus erythropolis]
MKTALTLTPKPKVVLFVAQPKAVWQSVIPAYEKAGVGLIANVVGPLEIEGPVVANTNGPPYIEQMHSDIANWFIADSEGTGKVLKYEVNDLPVLSTGNDVFRETVKEGCSQCSVKVLAGSIAQASSGEGVPAMISALQADPSIKYLITDYSAWFSGIRSALNAAGLDDVKVGSTSALPTTLSDVKSGAQQATTLLNNAYLAWVGVDAALRFTAGQPVGPEHSNTPVRLITSDTDFAIPEEPSPVDYQTQFKKLWNVG